MAVSSAQVTVTTTAQELSQNEADGDGHATLLLSNNGSVDLYVGPSGVTTGTGFKVAAGASLSVDLSPGERLFGVTGSSSSVHVLRTGV